MKKIISFCKSIPGWSGINQDIQLKMIKGGLTESMVLHGITQFDKDSEMIRFMDGKIRSKDAFYLAGFNPDMVTCTYTLSLKGSKDLKD